MGPVNAHAHIQYTYLELVRKGLKWCWTLWFFFEFFEDKFNLSTEERFAGRLPPCSADAGSLPHRTALGKAFLQSLQEKSWPGARARMSQDVARSRFCTPQVWKQQMRSCCWTFLPCPNATALKRAMRSFHLIQTWSDPFSSWVLPALG